MSDNVTVLGSRLERWVTAYESDHPDKGDIRIKVSDRGRILIGIGSENCILDQVAGATALAGIIWELIQLGSDPPPEPNDPVFMKVR